MAVRKRKSGGSKFLFLLIASAFLLLIVLPTAILAIVGMAPSLLILVMDNHPGRYLFRCVAALNFAGLAPFLGRLWHGSNSVSGAMGIITDPMTWAVVYSTAGLGWIGFLFIPAIVDRLNTMMRMRKLAQLRAKQKALVDEWGESIAASTKPGALMTQAPEGATTPSGASA